MRLTHSRTLSDDFPVGLARAGYDILLEADVSHFHDHLGESRIFGKDTLLYWQMAAPNQRAFVQVGVSYETGRALRLALVTYDRAARVVQSCCDGPGPLAGVPAFSLDWVEPGADVYDGFYHHEVAANFAVEVAHDAIRVVLFPEPAAYRLLTRGRVFWEFNSQAELVAFAVIGLAPVDVAALGRDLGAKGG